MLRTEGTEKQSWRMPGLQRTPSRKTVIKLCGPCKEEGAYGERRGVPPDLNVLLYMPNFIGLPLRKLSMAYLKPFSFFHTFEN